METTINKNGPWTIKERSSKYKDSFIEVFEDEVIRPDGNPGKYSTVRMKEGVAVLPMDTSGNVYLTSQFRYAIEKQSLEVISGGMEQSESPLEAAVRETQEESGFEAHEWLEMGYVDIETSIIKGPVYLYLALNLVVGEKDPDDTEDIKLIKMPLTEAVGKVMDSEITHGPSCALILKAYNLLSEI